MRFRKLSMISAAGLLLAAPAAVRAVDTGHAEYQSLTYSGTQAVSAYAGGFPLTLVGVVLNNTEEWLNPAADYNTTPWNMGGQAQFVIQAVPGYGVAGDTGGTAVYLAQNYGNSWRNDSAYSYTNTEWLARLAELNLYNGTGDASGTLRAGALVKVTAQTGTYYGGKENINENHDKAAANHFTIEVLDADYGLPMAPLLGLAELKDAGNSFIFDITRATGCELYQSTLVSLGHVQVTGTAAWLPNSFVTVTDGQGRTFSLNLGRNDSFTGTPLVADGQWFSVTGILNQEAGGSGMDGYRLLVTNADAFVVPEPTALALLAAALLATVSARRRRQ
jgi:hypothetical protein